MFALSNIFLYRLLIMYLLFSFDEIINHISVDQTTIFSLIIFLQFLKRNVKSRQLSWSIILIPNAYDESDNVLPDFDSVNTDT